ncbi:hypothetical protein ACHAXT_009883 [Thalassiosira profunda]
MMARAPRLLALLALVGGASLRCGAFTAPAPVVFSRITTSLGMAAQVPPGGISLEEEGTSSTDEGEVVTEFASPSTTGAADSAKRVGINSRGAKMNEIDFTLAPSDVSLSRCYQMSKANGASSSEAASVDPSQSTQSLSLTRALNTASNRAVRRILLSRSWPSAEALNLSLRTVLLQQKEKEDGAKAGLVPTEGEGERDKMKCPVPRPILNVIMNRRGAGEADSASPSPRSSEEREQQWIENQIAVFRESYADVPGYDRAEAYLESILCLATSGEESPRVAEVMEGGAYVEPYKRLLSVIQSVGAVLEEVPGQDGDAAPKRRRIAKKLIDQDVCLSMLDKISLANERKRAAAANVAGEGENPLAIPYDAAARLAYDGNPENESVPFEQFKERYEADVVEMVAAKWKGEPKSETLKEESEGAPKGAYERGRRRRLASFARRVVRGEAGSGKAASGAVDSPQPVKAADVESTDSVPIVINPDDLGGVLLSAEEPTMTRQLNVLSNIVQRTLIFGGDQELVVLAETLDADKPAFTQRWYQDNPAELDVEAETRPGVQYLNSLIQLLRDCYAKGVLKEVSPTLPLSTAYRNAYERLTSSLIELGSGYVRPSSSSSSLSLAMTTTAATAKYLTSTAPAQIGKGGVWPLRQSGRARLVGTWDVEDVVGTQTIGTTEVTFKPQGELSVAPPMTGLRWRLDPGPTHLDTCTFQVLSDDGAILQYKGFVDRGSRLEARVSKRSVTMRGAVSFLMRDTESSPGMGDDYWNDVLPMSYSSGSTKFVASRNVNSGDGGSAETSQSSGSSRPQIALECPPLAEGEREILSGPNGPILVTQVAGSLYAVDATCPHLNLPMKKGKISSRGRHAHSDLQLSQQLL